MNGSRQERDRCRCCRCCRCCRRLFRQQTKKLRPASIVFCFWNLAQDFFSHPWKCNDGVLDRAVVVAPHGSADISLMIERSWVRILPAILYFQCCVLKTNDGSWAVQLLFRANWFTHSNQKLFQIFYLDIRRDTISDLWDQICQDHHQGTRFFLSLKCKHFADRTILLLISSYAEQSSTGRSFLNSADT